MTPSEPDLRALVDAALAGDRTQSGQLLREVQRMVAPYCRRRLAGLPATSIDDVLQEVGIGVLDALPRMRAPDRAIRPYLFTIARNKVVDAYRTAGAAVDLPTETLPERVDPAPGPDQLALDRDRATQAQTLMARLTEREREVLAMRLLGELSAAETGTALGMSDVAVRVTQHRALGRLRAMVAGLPPD